MPSCGGGDAAAECLGKILLENTTLRFLDISDNKITHKGVTKLSEGLYKNHTLAVLFLHWNNLDYRGGHALARMLAVNDEL